ncbi:hypothetical protein [Sphingomonas sp. 2SG]|uniref:hypothetical protein n=1 Tax=Sphingomonas sp. 2SG TaxID=2502201 RepID=UPI0010F553A4|nr:hypothetical protein [Sphingomonas sp. 2SG]
MRSSYGLEYVNASPMKPAGRGACARMASEDDLGSVGESTNWKALFLAFFIAVLGFLGTGLSSKIATPWIQSTVVALMTTIVSTALLQLIFEIALRRNVYREMLKLSGMSRNLAAQQVMQSGKLRSVDWGGVFRSKSEMYFLLTDPLPWIDAHIISLFENGKTRPIDVTFFVCDVNQGYAADVAASLAVDTAAYTASVKQAAERIERTWKALRDSGQLAKNSSIAVRLLDNRPLYTLVTCDDVTVLVVSSVTGRLGADTEYFYMHVGDRGFYPSSWYREQLSRLGGLPITFADRIV